MPVEHFYFENEDGSKIFFQKKGTKYSLFCPKERKTYATPFFGSRINEYFIRTQAFPLKKETPGDYIKEILFFSTPLEKIGQPYGDDDRPFNFSKTEKTESEEEKEGEEQKLPLSPSFTTELKTSKQEVEDNDEQWKYSTDPFDSLELTLEIAQFLQGKDLEKLIHLAQRDIFMSKFIKELLISTRRVDYRYFFENEKKQQHELIMEADKVKHLSLEITDFINIEDFSNPRAFIKSTKDFFLKPYATIRKFRSLKSIKFTFYPSGEHLKKYVDNDFFLVFSSAFSNFVDHFLEDKTIDEIMVYPSFFAPLGYLNQVWSCKIFRTEEFWGPLPEGLYHMDCEKKFYTEGDIGNVAILHAGILTNLEYITNNLNFENSVLNELKIHEDLPEVFKYLNTLQTLECYSANVKELPKNLVNLSMERIDGLEREFELSDPDNVFPKTLTRLHVSHIETFYVPSWLKSFSFNSISLSIYELNNNMNYFRDLKELNYGILDRQDQLISMVLKDSRPVINLPYVTYLSIEDWNILKLLSLKEHVKFLQKVKFFTFVAVFPNVEFFSSLISEAYVRLNDMGIKSPLQELTLVIKVTQFLHKFSVKKIVSMLTDELIQQLSEKLEVLLKMDVLVFLTVDLPNPKKYRRRISMTTERNVNKN